MSIRSSTSSRPSLNVLDGFRRAWRSTSEDELPEPREMRIPEKRDNFNQQYPSHPGRPLRAQSRLSNSQEDVGPDFRFCLPQRNEYLLTDYQQPGDRSECKCSKFYRNDRRYSNPGLGNQRTLDYERQNDAEIINGNSDDEDCRYTQTINKSEMQFRDIIEEDIYRTLQTDRWHRDGRMRGHRMMEKNHPKEPYSQNHQTPNRDDQPIDPSKRERNPNSHNRISNKLKYSDPSPKEINTSSANGGVCRVQNLQDGAPMLKSTETASVQTSKQTDRNPEDGFRTEIPSGVTSRDNHVSGVRSAIDTLISRKARLERTESFLASKLKMAKPDLSPSSRQREARRNEERNTGNPTLMAGKIDKYVKQNAGNTETRTNKTSSNETFRESYSTRAGFVQHNAEDENHNNKEEDMRTMEARAVHDRIEKICDRFGGGIYEKDKKELEKAIREGGGGGSGGGGSDGGVGRGGAEEKRSIVTVSQLCKRCFCPERYCFCAKMTGFYTTLPVEQWNHDDDGQPKTTDAEIQCDRTDVILEELKTLKAKEDFCRQRNVETTIRVNVDEDWFFDLDIFWIAAESRFFENLLQSSFPELPKTLDCFVHIPDATAMSFQALLSLLSDPSMEYSDPTLLSPEVAHLAEAISCPKISKMAQRKNAILQAHGLIEVYDPKSRQSHIYNNSDNRFEGGSDDEDDEDADEIDDQDDDFDVETFESRNVKETSKRRNMRKISTSEDRRRGGKGGGGGGRKRGRTLKRNETVNNFLATETEEEVASGVAVMGKSVTGPEPQSSFTPRTPNRSDHVTTNMEEPLSKAGFFLSPTAKTGDDESFDSSSENDEMLKKFLEFFSNRKSIEGTAGDGGREEGRVGGKGDSRRKEKEVIGTVNAREKEEDDGRQWEDHKTPETNETDGGHQQRLERTMESILEEMRLLRVREEDNRRRYNYANLNFNNNNNNNNSSSSSPLQYSKRIHERLRKAVAEKSDAGMVDASDKAGGDDKSVKCVDFEFEEKTQNIGETSKTKEDSTTMPERPLSPTI